MVSEFQPNPLQVMRGQGWQRYEATPLLYAAVEWISSKLDTALWNRCQREVRSPFHKDSSTAFETDGLSILGASSRGDDEGPPWNLKFSDIELNWYRHSWCWLTANRPLSNDEIASFLEGCLAIVDRCNSDLNYDGTKGEQTFTLNGEEFGESDFQRACREERAAKRKR